MTGIPKMSLSNKDHLIRIDQVDSEDHRENKNGINKGRLKFALIIFVLIAVLAYVIFIDKPHMTELHRMEHMDNTYGPEIDSASPYVDRFILFMKKYGRKYESNAETMKRFKVYEEKVRAIAEMNREGVHGAQYGENDMADWTDEEFQKTLLPMTFYKKLREEATFIRPNPPSLERSASIPDFFDWRARNVVTPVKAQGKCGSCWAFAATATVEAAFAIAYGEKRNLSEQTLLDCDLDDNACDGGDEDKAFRFIHRHGLAYADDLPYVAHRQNTCNINGNTTKIDVAYFLHPDEDSMIDWLLNFGPVNIGISVTQPMRSYKDGVFRPSDYDCKNKVIGLHALLITGYGTSMNGEKYWIVKNSWGDTWGVENGYIYFARGVNACGIEDEPIGILA
uniref:Cathepsin F-like peptidase n=1 Tax=Heterorhabditis bacteriophora TaxID=37862 RepID=A0A2P1N6V2_HETBA|nr:cathepsin F-like peptidase [Heterorhabditis bacteriophora]